jgi:hypothetical protein
VLAGIIVTAMCVPLMIHAMFRGRGFGTVAGEKRFNEYRNYILYVACSIYTWNDGYYGYNNNG